MPNGMYSNIPLELRSLNQWCLWKFVHLEGKKPTKVPYTPTGHKCSVTNSETFSSFNECFNILALGSYDGLGFIFTGTDYSGIDLDDPSYLADGNTPNPNYQSDLNRQIKIAHEFDSYSEVSPSGKGLHIIVKGKVPDGKRTNYIELYPSGRYFTMTGQVHNAKPVGDYEILLNQLWQQMGGVLNGSHHPIVASQPETITDEEILELARKHNAATFLDLEAGVWVSSYPSQSEADQAYLNIIAYYTNSKVQVERIFRTSKLMRAKVNTNKGYLPSSINKAFDMKVAPLDLGQYKNALEDKLTKLNGAVAQRSELVAHNGPVAGSNPASPTTFKAASNPEVPPGLLGEIATFIYQAAPRPVPEVALAAAIGLMAGICGRAYNVSGTGLNQYVLLLAPTGTGKEASAEGIDKLMSTIKMQVPTSTSFIGPGEIPSGTGLIRHLANNSQSFVSLIGEFGIKLQQISSIRASSAEVSLRRMILDLYNKSGFTRSMPASAYAKKEDSVSSIPSPAFSLIGESTPERFYGGLTEDMISEGLLPRFLLIDYGGDRTSSNRNHTSVSPSFSLIEKFASLCAQCESINHSNPRRVINVQFTEKAQSLFDEFDIYADNKIRGAKEVIRQLWNRAHIKALKLAAIAAVGENMINPVINDVHFYWAISLINSDIAALTTKFEAGEIGASSHEIKQVQEVIRVINDYVKLDFTKIEKYLQVKSADLHKDKIIPYIYLNKRLAPATIFKTDRGGGTIAIKRAIQTLIDSDRITELGKVWCNERYGTSQRCFIIKDTSMIVED